MHLHRLTLAGSLLFLAGCATQIQQQKMAATQRPFADGNLVAVASQIDDAFPQKNSLYFLEHGQVRRLMGPEWVEESTRDLLTTDRIVSDWENQARLNMQKSLSDFGGYLLAEGVNSDYELKVFEISLLSHNLALNQISAGRWDNAMVEARKIGQREQLISELLEKKVSALEEKSKEKSRQSKGATTRIEDIGGYPVNLLNDSESIRLKNAYQSAAAHYLAAFIYEKEGEISLAAPGYRLAIELRPDEPFLVEGLANLEKNASKTNNRSNRDATNNANNNQADTLFVIETGFLPSIESFKTNQPFDIGNGPKLMTLALPVIRSTKDVYSPNMIRVDNYSLQPRLITNVDAMVRRNLKDEMPGYVLRATSRAIASLIAQKAVDEQQKKRGNNNAAGSLAGLFTGLALQAINVADVRHWSTLPAHIYLARAKLPDGERILSYATPSGAVRNAPIVLSPGYNIVYLRMFHDRASLLTSNDSALLAMRKSDDKKLPAEAPKIVAEATPEKKQGFNFSRTFDGVSGLFTGKDKE